MNFKKLLFTVCACISVSAYADDPTDLYVDTAHFDDGDKIPYVFTPSRTMPPKYVLIMMPGGSGVMGISKNEDGTPFFNSKGNFLIASRAILSDSDIATISIDRGRSLNRMRAVVADIKSKYPNAKIYIAGTSRSTTETIYQSENMDGEVAGFIHTSSVSSIGGLDTRKAKSRNLIVVHKYDSCRVTPPSSGISNHEDYGTDLIVMEGGFNEGDICGPAAYHGYNGIRDEVTTKIREWIKKQEK
jgi:hypothetical protein